MTTLYIDKDKLYALAQQLYVDVPPKDETEFAAYKNKLCGLLFDIGIEQHTLLVQPTETAAIYRDMWVWLGEAGELLTDDASGALSLEQLEALGMLTPPPPPPEPEPEPEPETETPENVEAVEDGTEAES